MDITVTITDSRSLSQSELIMKNLFATVQVGRTSQTSSRGVLLDGAKFRSGSMENPLVVTLKNSQTETVMYVRNIPVSTVLDRHGLYNHWVAVYPPGDPQNLHFDASAAPKEGCPQVCVTVTIEEDLSTTQAVPQARQSYGFAPSHRQSNANDLSPAKIDELRRSVDSLHSQLKEVRSGSNLAGAESGAAPLSARPASSYLHGGGSATSDSTLREKELQAQRIKEHVAEMANAQRRAQDMSRNLGENNRILEDMKRQFKGLEMQLAEQRAAVQILERDRDQLRKEEQQLQEQIRQRDIAFQELRDNRDEIDRELTRVLSEGERQKHSMEQSSRQIASQRESVEQDIEQSRRQVAQLAASLQSREEMLAESERRARDEEERRNSQEAAERESLRVQLDQTRMAVAGARQQLDDTQRRRQNADMSHQEVVARLAGIESEVESLSSAVQSKGSDTGRESVNAQEDLKNKRDKLEAHAKKVEMLENELSSNREQLEKLSSRIAELHTEAHEKELAAKRCEDERGDLEKRLEAQQRGAAEAKSHHSSQESQLAKAQVELKTAEAALEAIQASARQAPSLVGEAEQLEKGVNAKRDELASTRSQVDNLQQTCDALSAKAQERRAFLQERSEALDMAQQRVAELTKSLAEAAAAITSSDAELRHLAESVSGRQVALEEARQQARQRLDEIALIEAQTQRTLEATQGRISDLDQTAVVARSEIDTVTAAKRQSEQQCAEMEANLAENQGALTRLQDQIQVLLSAKESGEKEVEVLNKEHEEAAAAFRQGGEELARLEEESRRESANLDATRSHVSARLREVGELEQEHQNELARMEAEAGALAAKQADGQREHARLLAELDELRSDRDTSAERVAAIQREREAVDSELERVRAEKMDRLKQSQDKLQLTQSQLLDVSGRASSSAARRAETEVRLRAARDRRMQASTRLTTVKEEIEQEGAGLQEAEAQLQEKQEALEGLRSELEKHEEEASMLDGTRSAFEAEAQNLKERLRAEEAAASELQVLQNQHSELLEARNAEEERYKEEILKREQEIEEARSELERKGSEMLQKKNQELEKGAEQVSTLEAERQALLQQLGRLEAERRDLEDNLGEREQVRKGLLEDARQKAQQCDALQDTISATKTFASELEQKELEAERALSAIQERERLLRSEAQERAVQIQKVKAELESSDKEAERVMRTEAAELERLRHECEEQVRQGEEFKKGVAAAQAESVSTLNDCNAIDRQVDELKSTLAQVKSQVNEAQVNRESQRELAQRRASELQQTAQDREQHSKLQLEADMMKRSVQEYEEALQQMSNRLVEAQEAVRRRRAEEEELRADIQNLKENMRGTNDKMSYQVEHGNLQFESIQKLEENKRQFEGEVEVLTLGLHDAEQRNSFLQKENALMQQQVEGLYDGSLQDWAAEVHRVKVEAEVVCYKEEIDLWRQKAEQMRREKQQELGGLQRQHEETVRQLRERIVAIQTEIESCEQIIKRREKALAKRKELGEQPSSPTATAAMPGLVVPQRPLPNGHRRRKALLVGINYTTSHAPLKGCVNDLWNLQCLLRHTLQYTDDQLQLLIDCADGRPHRPDRAPTKANIMMGLSWLMHGAQPGDSLLFVFCGYGAQHPRTPGSDQYEAYLVPSDFGAELPEDFFTRHREESRDAEAAPDESNGAGYRLVPLLELSDMISRLPPMCRVTCMMDCCYSIVPNVSAGTNFPTTFPRVKRGHVDYSKLRDFISRPRFLELPVLPVQHTPSHIRPNAFPACWLHCFSGCKLEEWAAEFPIEGTVQGAFSWAFLKALARGHFHCGLYQFQRMLSQMLSDLKVHFRGVEQTPTLQLSQAASMQDVVLWT